MLSFGGITLYCNIGLFHIPHDWKSSFPYGDIDVEVNVLRLKFLAYPNFVAQDGQGKINVGVPLSIKRY